MTDKKLISREEVLGGMGGRLAKQASTLLSLIENRTVFLIEDSQQITTMFLTERGAQQRHQAFLEAIALDRELPIQPTIQDLEHYAPQWAALVPDNSRIRAMVAHLLAQKYVFTYQATPHLRAALGFDDAAVQQAYQTLHQEPLAAIFATHPGLNEETLFSIAISHALAIIMRPDQQDYEGTGVTVEVARSLDVPRMMLVVNKTPSSFDPAEVRARVEQTYNCEVAAILPLTEEMFTLASTGIFALHYPDHPLTARYKEVAARLMA